jgi:hypothetical protein
MEKFLVALNAGKSLATGRKRSLFALECSKMRCRLGLCPRPRWGSLQRSPNPLAVEGERRSFCVMSPGARDPSYASVNYTFVTLPKILLGIGTCITYSNSGLARLACVQTSL